MKASVYSTVKIHTPQSKQRPLLILPGNMWVFAHSGSKDVGLIIVDSVVSCNFVRKNSSKSPKIPMQQSWRIDKSVLVKFQSFSSYLFLLHISWVYVSFDRVMLIFNTSEFKKIKLCNALMLRNLL